MFQLSKSEIIFVMHLPAWLCNRTKFAARGPLGNFGTSEYRIACRMVAWEYITAYRLSDGGHSGHSYNLKGGASFLASAPTTWPIRCRRRNYYFSCLVKHTSQNNFYFGCDFASRDYDDPYRRIRGLGHPREPSWAPWGHIPKGA